jgi:hypothetical protein
MHRVRQSRAGQRGRCPCGNIFQVPDPSPPDPPDVIDLSVSTWQPLTRSARNGWAWASAIGHELGITVVILVIAVPLLLMLLLSLPKVSGDSTDVMTLVKGLMGLFILLVIAAVAIAFYLLPTIIAVLRKHQHMPAIAAVNILLGWSFLGWVAALVWALTESRSRDHHHYHYNNP